jgi:hypothetical protein
MLAEVGRALGDPAPAPARAPRHHPDRRRGPAARTAAGAGGG